jgi:mono/diheme cytochrome c family protein
MQADTSKSPQWNRGAYLVQALGHCEACHTAKDFLGGPKKGENFRGGLFGTWFAPDITSNHHTGIGGWTDDELREFLRKGLNVHSAASGEMGEMVAFSSSQMTDDDLNAVIAYLRGIPAAPEEKVAQPDAGVMKQGEAIWQDTCSACHRMDASGVPRYFPPLAHNADLQQRDPTTILHYILAGTRRVPNDRAQTPLSMPAYDWKLDDQQVAAVATYVRNAWGNSAPAVKADDVRKLRAQLHFDNVLPAQNPPHPGDMAHPGPNTLAPAGSDSRDNGTANAGRAAPSDDKLQQAAGPSGSGGSGGQSASGGGQKKQGKGHPAGVPTPGPG